MRLISCVLLPAIFFFSCNNANHDKEAGGADTAQASASSGPRTVMDAITDLKNTLQSGNRSNIADLFDFPVADTIMRVYLDDSVFQENYRAAGDKITKSMFMNYFDTIARFNNLSDIIEGFKYLPLDSLKYKNRIEKVFKSKDEPCTREYSIEVENGLVRFQFTTNQSDLFKSKGNDEEDARFNSGCEYASWWTFRFDGSRLRFVRHDAAG